MPDVTGENSTTDLSRDLVCLVPQIMLQLPLPVSFCVPGIARNSGSPGGQVSVVARRAVPPCTVKGWAPHHQGYSIRVQLITSQGISALWKRLNSEVSFSFKNPLISLLLDSVVFNSLRHHGLQHTRLPCPSPTPGACSNSRPLSRWCHPTISSFVVPFSSHLQSFPHQGLFQWVSYSHQVGKVLEFQLQHQSFQWIFRTDFL